MQNIDTVGSEEPTIDSDDLLQLQQDFSENVVDTDKEERNDGPKVTGECRILLHDDETVSVSFPVLGRWTPGRLEKAMQRVFYECMLARQQHLNRSEGRPEHFNLHGSEEP